MSRTFTSRPPTQTRGRGSTSTRARGRGNILNSSSPQVTSTSTSPPSFETTRGRMYGRGRSNPFGERQSPGSTSSRGGPSTRGRGISDISRGRGISRGMNPPGGDPNFAQGGAEGDPQSSEQQDPGRGQYAGGYTMFAPNERKRNEVARMAQSETAAYEQYKQQNSTKVYNHVGTVGGGEMTQEQARARQANAVRAQKFNRQMHQVERRESTRRYEDEQIEAKRAEARRKAEQNLLHQGKAHAPNELRRNREAFLQQFEKDTAAAAAQQQSQTSTKGSGVTKQSSPQSERLPQARRSPAATVFRTTASDSTRGHRFPTSTRPPLETAPYNSSDTSDSATEAYPRVRSRDHSSNTTQPARETTQYHPELEIVSSMFPDLDLGYLNDLLFQMGSADAVVDMLGVVD